MLERLHWERETAPFRASGANILGFIEEEFCLVGGGQEVRQVSRPAVGIGELEETIHNGMAGCGDGLGGIFGGEVVGPREREGLVVEVELEGAGRCVHIKCKKGRTTTTTPTNTPPPSSTGTRATRTSGRRGPAASWSCSV